MNNSKKLDQFYTNPFISDKLVLIIKNLLPSQFKKNFLEPSAGTGNFINSIKKAGVIDKKITAYDIDPKIKNIHKKDYLKEKIKFSNDRIIIGNPPFGKRGRLALEFLNKGLMESPFVAMILPNIFNRYSVQKNINQKAKLIYSKKIPENAFILNDKEYGVKCVFQIWTTELTYADDLRIKTPPAIRHEDFQTWIHNNTKATLKYFNQNLYQWDFAVHRQGYYNYNELITNPRNLVKNRQYFFIKAKNKKVLETIKKIDFDHLSKTNTQVYGFSTSDFVREYKKIKSY